ncbi:MAG: collagen alpha-2(XI) chain-like [Solirubrobacterales bacterium]|nr:collagen alpha-2(XI) chain-like [Solirubrobacterales bacterium]
MKRFRFRPTYSNVVATLALFFALAGGAWAATQLPKESVGSAQLAKGAVTPAKLSDQAKKGFTGARGEAGAQGALGPRGNEGQRGENGAAGATGPQGIRGATGATGATGSRGEPGETGLRGERGERGPIGEHGEKGDTGQRGLEGPPGPEGDPGPEGSPGLEGQPGSEGKQGEEGKPGPTGPSDAYFDVSEPGAIQVGHDAKVVLEVTNVPAGEYVLQAAFSLEGVVVPAIAECQFVAGGSEITVGTAAPFSTNVTTGDFASLAGMGTAVAAEPGNVYVICGTAVEGTNFIIPPESGHLTATMVGALHPPTP